MSRIGTDHLALTAFVYIRQSTPEQVRHNLESQRRQYALAERARALGWREVVVLDEDLGRSGSGVKRPGFERLLAAICQRPILQFRGFFDPRHDHDGGLVQQSPRERVATL
jgi:hypothetical protein